MRILFVMAHPGFLRFYDKTLDVLIARGHKILLAFDDPSKQSDAMAAIDHRPEIDVLGSWPKRHDEWFLVARGYRHSLDYLRYLDPTFASASFLRRRSKQSLANMKVFDYLRQLDYLPSRAVKALIRLLLWAETRVPSDPGCDQFLEEVKPDTVLVTPLVNVASPQVDIVKSCQGKGIPVAACIASWDNLTNKGHMKIHPDRVILWNQAQREEAVQLHDFPEDRIILTGIQHFDEWFERKPAMTAEDFRRKVGLKADRYVLYLASNRSLVDLTVEESFLKRWIDSLRGSSNEDLRNLGVLIRPHPLCDGTFNMAALDPLGKTAIWPRDPLNVVSDENRATFFESMYHAIGVTGINTTAMIEASILGKSVFSIVDDSIRESQFGTVHFRYFQRDHGGTVEIANNFEEHHQQLLNALEGRAADEVAIRDFVKRFVRPFGLDKPAVPILADAIESLGNIRVLPYRAWEQHPISRTCVRLLASALFKREYKKQRAA